LPGSTVLIDQGNHSFFITNATVEQPLTQLIKLRAARHAAQADVRASQADLRRVENEVALQVRQVYIEILIGRLEMQAMTLQISAADQSLKENTDGVSTGNLLEVAVLGPRTNLLKSKYQLSKLENQISDLTGDLNDLTGLPVGTELELAPITTEAETPRLSLAEYRDLGIKQNPETRLQWKLPRKRGRVSESRRRTIFPMSAPSRSTHIRTVCRSWFTTMARSACG
jgi:outer membrane protein TolC